MRKTSRSENSFVLFFPMVSWANFQAKLYFIRSFVWWRHWQQWRLIPKKKSYSFLYSTSFYCRGKEKFLDSNQTKFSNIDTQTDVFVFDSLFPLLSNNSISPANLLKFALRLAITWKPRGVEFVLKPQWPIIRLKKKQDISRDVVYFWHVHQTKVWYWLLHIKIRINKVKTVKPWVVFTIYHMQSIPANSLIK